jgi:hypothetical protein
VVSRLEPARIDAPQQVHRPQRLAAVREGDDDAVPSAQQRTELRLGLGQPTRRDRRPLRLEGVLLPARERIELPGPK